MHPSRPLHPDGVGGTELFADPNSYTSVYHNAQARELERRAGAATHRALADALRRVARRHHATALALAGDGEPAGRAREASGPRPAAWYSSARRTATARSA